MTAVAKKILIIQTAFLGDVVLATAVIESLKSALPEAQIDFLLRKGNESLLENHPLLRKIWVLDKSARVKNTFRMIQNLRSEKYDLVVNLQRFMTSGLLAAFSGAREIRGFKKNPLSILFSKSFRHEITVDGQTHEIERNHAMIVDIAPQLHKPRLYPLEKHESEGAIFRSEAPFICIAPASVWFTKQWPIQKWVEFLNSIPNPLTVYFLGAPGDSEMVTAIREKSTNNRLTLKDLCGKLSLLGSAALMRGARMNYVNDSAPLHLASAVNAPVTAIFCSTVPSFGFTPLSENAVIVETRENLRCRPCGLHGHRACPEGHFNCALTIDNKELLNRIS